eukprot:6259528-Alexandrium_andersonii.AAC.1
MRTQTAALVAAQAMLRGVPGRALMQLSTSEAGRGTTGVGSRLTERRSRKPELPCPGASSQRAERLPCPGAWGQRAEGPEAPTSVRSLTAHTA